VPSDPPGERRRPCLIARCSGFLRFSSLKGDTYRDHVFAYVEQEGTPRPLMFQLHLLKNVGFATVEVLHKNNCFAAFGAVKAK